MCGWERFSWSVVIFKTSKLFVEEDIQTFLASGLILHCLWLFNANEKQHGVAASCLFWLGKSEHVACFSEIWQHLAPQEQSSRVLLVCVVGASCAIAEVSVFFYFIQCCCPLISALNRVSCYFLIVCANSSLCELWKDECQKRDGS